jgi:nitroreductase
MINPNIIESWLEVACRAPSPHNNQPWAARIEPSGVTLRLDKNLIPSLGPDRLQFAAMGAFVENLHYAAAISGYSLLLTPPPTVPHRETELHIQFAASGAPSQRDHEMLEAAWIRRTNRGDYLTVLPYGALEALRDVPHESGTGVVFLDAPDERRAAADLAARAMRVVFSVNELRHDLAPFVFTAIDGPRTVGMPLASMCPAAPTTGLSGNEWVMEVATAEGESEAARQRFGAAPLHFVVTCDSDVLPSWIAGGRTLQRVLLTATNMGLSHCLAAGPSEIPTLLPGLRQLIGQPTGRPLLLGRLGVPAEPTRSIASPRRTIQDILTFEG